MVHSHEKVAAVVAPPPSPSALVSFAFFFSFFYFFFPLLLMGFEVLKTKVWQVISLEEFIKLS